MELKTVLLNGADLSSPNLVFMEHLPLMLSRIWSEDSDSQLDAVVFLRKLLSIKQNPPRNDVVQSGVVPRIVKFLTRDDFPKLQLEATWVLTNIASGTSDNTKYIVESGAIPILIQLLNSASDDVREKAVWALANVAGDSPKYRDLVLNHNAMMPLLSQLVDQKKLSLLRNATWALSNFCCGKPQPSFEQVKPALPFLERLIQSTDEDVLRDACWALYYLSDSFFFFDKNYLSDSSKDKIQAVIDAGVIPRLIQLLSHSSPSVLNPALHTIGNITCGDGDQTQTVLNHQVLPCLLNLITNTYEVSIKTAACRIISNITARNSNQIQAVIEADIIQALVVVLQTAELEVKNEAAWGILNATSNGTNDQIKYMVRQGCIKLICDLLTCTNPRIIKVCLKAVEKILVVGESERNLGHTEGDNLYVTMVDEAGGLEKIDDLQYDENKEIKQKAAKILETYWVQEDDKEDNDENHVPFGFVWV